MNWRDILFPWRRQLRELRRANENLEERLIDLSEQRDAAFAKADNADWMANVTEDSARAQLMQLRVHGMQDAQSRTGYGVTAFIPAEVLRKVDKLGNGTKKAFVEVIAEELVRRALVGMWNVNSRGTFSALVFAPIQPGQPLQAVGAIHDSERGPEIVLGTPPKQTADMYWLRTKVPRIGDSPTPQ